MTQRSAVWTLAILALAPAQAAVRAEEPASKEKKVDPKKVIVTVNGEPIREKSVQRTLRTVPKVRQSGFRNEVVDQLIEQRVLDQYLKKSGVRINAKEIDQRFTKMKSTLTKKDVDYKEVLSKMLLTEKELRDHISADLRWEKFSKKLLSEKAARDYFKANKDVFDGTMVRARHVLIKTKDANPEALAQAKAKLLLLKQRIDKNVAEALKKLPGDTDNLTRAQARNLAVDEAFVSVAKTGSDCPSSLSGGDIGWFHRSGTMVEPIAKTAFNLQRFETSDVVRTRFGFHLVLVTDRRPGRAIKFEDVKDQVLAHYKEHVRKDLTAQLRKSAKIVYDESIEK